MDDKLSDVKASIPKGKMGRQELARGLATRWVRARGIRPATRWKRWISFLEQGWEHLRRAPVTTFLTVLTIGVTLTLLGFMMFLLMLLSDFRGNSRDTPLLTVFFRNGVAQERARSLEDELRRTPGVAGVEYLTDQEVLERFRRSLGNDALLLEGFGDKNPLPQALLVHVDGVRTDAGGQSETLKELKEVVSGRSEVEYVHYPEESVRQLARLFSSLRSMFFIGVLGLAVTCLVIILNTIRLALFSFRAELEVLQLLGGTEGFIRAPFMVEGGLHGFFGSLLALFFLNVIVGSLGTLLQPVALFELFGTIPSVLPWTIDLVVLLIGVVAGGVGSAFAASYHLRKSAG